MSGLVAAGLFYILLSILIRVKGSGFIHRLLPPIVTGPVIMTIGTDPGTGGGADGHRSHG
jgi:uracil permease